MVPGIKSVSASDPASGTRVVPPALPDRTSIAAQKPPQAEPPDTFKPVRVGPVYNVSPTGKQAAEQRDSQRDALNAATEKAATDRNADNRVLQQKLYGQF